MKIPVEEYVEHLASLEIEGKIKYLLLEVEKIRKEQADLQKKLREHFAAHHAMTEAREGV